jgi:hypothetical protein
MPPLLPMQPLAPGPLASGGSSPQLLSPVRVFGRRGRESQERDSRNASRSLGTEENSRQNSVSQSSNHERDGAQQQQQPDSARGASAVLPGVIPDAAAAPSSQQLPLQIQSAASPRGVPVSVPGSPEERDRDRLTSYPSARQQPAPPGSGSMRFLVVDDDTINRSLLLRMLGKLFPGCACDAAFDGQQAVRAFEHGPQYSAILMVCCQTSLPLLLTRSMCIHFRILPCL